MNDRVPFSAVVSTKQDELLRTQSGTAKCAINTSVYKTEQNKPPCLLAHSPSQSRSILQARTVTEQRWARERGSQPPAGPLGPLVTRET